MTAAPARRGPDCAPGGPGRGSGAAGAAGGAAAGGRRDDPT